MNSKILILLSIIILIVVLGTSLFLKNSNNPTNPKINVSVTPKSNEKIATSTTVNVTPEGFSPKELEVGVGTQVIWVNNSGKAVTVNSDEYPTNLLWNFLNLGSFNNGQSVSTVFEKNGKYRYHNQNDPAQTGSVTVK